MTIKRIPIIPTLLVLIAVGVLVRLGFWQLDRLHQKEAALIAYNQASTNLATAELAGDNPEQRLAFRRVRAPCPNPSEIQRVSGRNFRGESGWAHVVLCKPWTNTFDVSTNYALILGWSKDLREVKWSGGPITGYLIPGYKGGVQLPKAGRSGASVSQNLNYHIVADPPLAGLEANAKPDPANIANNHLSYAVQWFLFALTALVIYALALRKRLAA